MGNSWLLLQKVYLLLLRKLLIQNTTTSLLWAIRGCRVLIVSQLSPVLRSYCCCLLLILLVLLCIQYYFLWTFTKSLSIGTFKTGRRMPHVVCLTALRLCGFSGTFKVVFIDGHTACRTTMTSCHSSRWTSSHLHSNRGHSALARLLPQSHYVPVMRSTTCWTWSLTRLLWVTASRVSRNSTLLRTCTSATTYIGGTNRWLRQLLLLHLLLRYCLLRILLLWMLHA